MFRANRADIAMTSSSSHWRHEQNRADQSFRGPCADLSQPSESGWDFKRYKTTFLILISIILLKFKNCYS